MIKRVNYRSGSDGGIREQTDRDTHGYFHFDPIYSV